MSKLKIFGLSVSAIVALMVLVFSLGLFDLGYFKFFGPKKENIKREIFENTKSYLHGVQQDLGKYYSEYQMADEDGKAAIRATILMRFAEVDASKLQSIQLQSFLTNMRGY